MLYMVKRSTEHMICNCTFSVIRSTGLLCSLFQVLLVHRRVVRGKTGESFVSQQEALTCPPCLVNGPVMCVSVCVLCMCVWGRNISFSPYLQKVYDGGLVLKLEESCSDSS